MRLVEDSRGLSDQLVRGVVISCVTPWMDTGMREVRDGFASSFAHRFYSDHPGSGPGHKGILSAALRPFRTLFCLLACLNVAFIGLLLSFVSPTCGCRMLERLHSHLQRSHIDAVPVFVSTLPPKGNGCRPSPLLTDATCPVRCLPAALHSDIYRASHQPEEVLCCMWQDRRRTVRADHVPQTLSVVIREDSGSLCSHCWQGERQRAALRLLLPRCRCCCC